MAHASHRPLILSGLPHDLHASAVRWGLRRAGIDALWLHSYADPALEDPISFECDDRHGVRWHGAMASEHMGSVWYRRYRHPGAEQLTHASASDRDFIGNEWKRFGLNVNALAEAIPGSFWVNPPLAASNAENKLVQLRAAHQCGLRFPQTLVSSDPTRIRAFVAKHGRAIYKPFQIHSWQDAQGKIHSTYTRIVTVDMLQDDASLRLCPGIFQTLVEKTHDLRVTVIGEQFFTTKLESPQENDFADWRIASLGQRIRSSIAALPDSIMAQVKALMGRLDLVFGCVDFVADADGKLHFLEINQSGQFLFLEEDVPGLPLLRAICAMLAQGGSHYAMAGIPDDVNYANYIASNEHKIWWDSVSGGIRKQGHIPGVSREA